jgi:hypothetical protein
MILYQLSRPAAYLLIKDSSKWKIDWGLPAIFSIIISLTFFLTKSHTSWLKSGGLIDDLQGFLQILPGFYLTALAAIATFSKRDLDLELPDPTPTILIKFIRHNRLHKKTINLTRRRMLCYLFGYLTFLSLTLYLITVFAPTNLIKITSYVEGYSNHLNGFLKSIFQFFFWQMIIVTIFGLYQLCDKIHQPES